MTTMDERTKGMKKKEEKEEKGNREVKILRGKTWVECESSNFRNVNHSKCSVKQR